MDAKIIEFISNNNQMTIATSHNNIPFCAICFYAFLKSHQMIVFTSHPKTKHIPEALLNKEVAGTITVTANAISKLQGIQFGGIFLNLSGNLLTEAKKEYIKKFPFAAVFNIPYWGIKLQIIKMTDNKFGFGKKIIWEENIQTVDE
jgi:uncharacterized protein YhbP (UPF0306 family)